MSKILYPIFNLPNENDAENEAIPTWIKWWMINNYKKRSWVLSEIITGNPLLLENSVETKFYLPPLPRGNSEQVQYSGKQLLPFTNQDVTLGGVTFKAINGRLILNGTATENINGSYFINNYFKVHLTQGNYILSRTNVNSNLTIMFLSSNVDVIGRLSRDSSDLTNSFTISAENDYYIGFYISSGVSFNNYDSGVMVSTTGGAYEPYVGGTASPNPSYPSNISNVTGDVEVAVQNKNLFDKDNVTTGYTYSSTGTLVELSSSFVDERYIPVTSSTEYSLSTQTNYSSTVDYRLVICEYDKNKNFIKRNIAFESGVTKSTITTTSSTKYVRLCASTVTLDELQFEKGNSRTTYTPHQEQTYTFPLGTQRMYAGDYLADDGIHHMKRQVVFDGSSDENWRYESSTTTPTNRTVIVSNNFMNYKRNANYLSNCFIKGSTSSNRLVLTFASITDNTTYLSLEDSIVGIETTDSNNIKGDKIKTWLSTHNVTVEYELATEEITAYTTEQQQAYDEIKQAISYEEQTNISGTSSEAEPLFEVQYYMKNESEGE